MMRALHCVAQGMQSRISLARHWLVAALLAATASAALAAPAPWYYWRSQQGGYRVCAQTAPGPGWVRDSVPHDGPGCQRPRTAAQPLQRP